MTATYIPQVGDRVRSMAWRVDSYVTITAVGCTQFLANDKDGNEGRYYFGAGWVKVPEPVVHPERWMNVYPDHVMNAGWRSRVDADADADADRIAVIHLAADGTYTLHPVEGLLDRIATLTEQNGELATNYVRLLDLFAAERAEIERLMDGMDSVERES